MYSSPLPLYSARILHLSVEKMTSLLSELVQQPLNTILDSLFKYLVEQIHARTKDIDMLVNILQDPKTLKNVPSNSFLLLKSDVRQDLWGRIPVRCSGDILHLLMVYDQEIKVRQRFRADRSGISPIAAPYNFCSLIRSKENLDLDRKIIAHNKYLSSIRRQRYLPSFSALEVAARSSVNVYKTICSLIQKLFETSRNPQWCILRRDLAVALGTPKNVKGVASHAGNVLKSYDPLESIVLNIESIFVGQTYPSFHRLMKLVHDFINAPDASTSHTVRTSEIENSSNPFASAPTHSNLQHIIARTKNFAKNHKHGDALGSEFLIPVVERYPLLKQTYMAKISRPMDLRTMETKARSGAYKTWVELLSDARLMVENCETFNSPTHALAIVARDIERCMIQEIKKLSVSAATNAAQDASNAGIVMSSDLAIMSASIHPSSRSIMQLLMLLAEPSVTRAAVHVVAQYIYRCAEKGLNILTEREAVAALSALAIGDLAFALPMPVVPGTNGVAISTSAAHQRPLEDNETIYDHNTYTELLLAAREIVAAAHPEFQQNADQISKRPIIPMALSLTCSALRTMHVQDILEKNSDSAGMDVGAITFSAPKSIVDIGMGKHLHGRSVSLLALIVSANYGHSDALALTIPRVSRILGCAALGNAPVMDDTGNITGAPIGIPEPASFITLLHMLRTFHRRTIVPNVGTNVSKESVAAERSKVSIHILKAYVIPTLNVVSAKGPAWLVPLLHEQVAVLLDSLAKDSVISRTDLEEVLTVIFQYLNPDAERLRATCDAVQYPRLSALLNSGLITPPSLAWSTNNMVVCAYAYSVLIEQYLKSSWNWQSFGIAPGAVENMGLPTGTPHTMPTGVDSGFGVTPHTPFSTEGTPLNFASPSTPR